MALGIVKYAYDRSSQLIGVIWFAVSLFAVSLFAISLSWSIVVDPLFPGRIYIARCPWYFWDFRNIFLPNITKDQKSLTIRARGPWHSATWTI